MFYLNILPLCVCFVCVCIDELTDSSVAWIPSLSMHVPDLDNAPIRLNALIIEHAFGTSNDVTRRVSNYYTRQLWKQIHKVLGSFDFLGNPAGLLDHLGTAVIHKYTCY